MAITGERLNARMARAIGPTLKRLRLSSRFILTSSTFRLALLYMLLVGISVAILLGFIYWSTAGYMARQTDATIGAEIQGLAEQYRRRGLAGLSTVIAERIARNPQGASIYLLANPSGNPIIGNLHSWPPVTPDAGGWISFRTREPQGEGLGIEHETRAQVFRLRGDLRLLVGRDVRELTAIRQLILDAMTWGLAITVGLALLGGWLMGAGIVRRLDIVNQVSREIMQGDLSRRVPTSGAGDDFDQLAENLNRMLERIEALMLSIRQVSDNIAHDLRTPLTRLRNRLELLQGADLSDEARAEVEVAIADADELLSAFNALLRIARIEAGSRRAAFADIDPVTLLQDVAELYEPLAAESLQTISVESDQENGTEAEGDTSQGREMTAGLPRIGSPGDGKGCRLNADRDLLFQAIANLVDNAIKHHSGQGQIQLRAECTDAAVELSVTDRGPGIPPELRDKVLQRFFRIDESRAAPGHGLGLSLVQAVAQLHGAELRLEDASPGLRVRLRLPKKATPA
ncbi:MAG: HAMP domain-containing sensor histidine kinase [Lamprobacter sp.]|uniref:sensor histidine kinase n=1 Tax=Lamprobacter sp. TaxID=3100796 RepID=UPI002B25A3B5|nr:HAMP domain-containing sensor histidine kinase [Lamprobacter sp.]MEA3639031.1 HAMP domain-containing sensor histidine kinase [Lamprobacter sp.]